MGLELLYQLNYVLAVIYIFKCLTVGSDFSFYYWLTRGSEYNEWYFKREKFSDFERNRS
jgi:hypothetical protein